MPTVSFPGVYIQEVPSGVHTITGVSTSIAAFFGRAVKGPLDKAVRILSVSDFERTFGGQHPSSDLTQSVLQFFNNGGTDCYVVRIANGAAKAGVTLRTIGGINALVVTAKTAGLWGMGIKLDIDYKTPNPDETFNLTVTQEDGGVVVATEQFTGLSMQPTHPRFAPSFVSNSSQLIDVAPDTGGAGIGDPNLAASPINILPGGVGAITQAGYSQSRLPIDVTSGATIQGTLNPIFAATGRFEISVNGSQWIPIDWSPTGNPLVLAGANAGAVATEIQTALNTALNNIVLGLAVAVAFDRVGPAALNRSVLRITSNSGDMSSVRIRRAQTGDMSGQLLFGIDNGGIEVVRFSNLRPVPTGLVFTGGTTIDAFAQPAAPAVGNNGINQFAGMQAGDINQITVAGTNVALNLVTTGVATDPVFLDAGLGSDGVREKLAIIRDAVNNDPTVGWKADLWGHHLVFRKPSGTINDSGTVASAGPGGLANRLGLGFVANTRLYALGNTGTSPFQTAPVVGSDGVAPIPANFIGNPALQTGMHALDPVDLFNLMVIPGDRDISEAQMNQIVGPASIYCQERRAFLILDAPDSWTSATGLPVATDAQVNSLRALVVKDYSAVFYPGITGPFGPGGAIVNMGASGLIAGVFARIDSTRGVWKAPAGVEADLRGILDLEVNLTDPQNGVLNKLGVNCLRKFPSGMVNWGARTLDGSDDIGSEWKYISIRRTALFIEESLFRGTKWVVFEGNDEPLWAKIRLNLNAFMMGLFRQGAFQGTTPDKAFFVKCDAETTTQADRNLGIVNIIVGFAPLKPAEFVIIKIQQIAGEL